MIRPVHGRPSLTIIFLTGRIVFFSHNPHAHAHTSRYFD